MSRGILTTSTGVIIHNDLVEEDKILFMSDHDALKVLLVSLFLVMTGITLLMISRDMMSIDVEDLDGE